MTIRSYQMKRNVYSMIAMVFMLIIIACTDSGSDFQSETDASTDGDSDGDSDGDTDGDADGGDGDADGDGDGGTNGDSSSIFDELYGLVWVSIPGGSFMMGDNDGYENEQPEHLVTLSPFKILKSEVTALQYLKAFNDGFCSEHTPILTPEKCVFDRSEYNDHPVNCLNWEQALGFCMLVGGQLPSEAEWEYVARNGSAETSYPWGEEQANCDRVVMSEGGDGCGTGLSWPVCSKPKGNTSHGICDMGGNLSEFVLDGVSQNYVGAPADGRALNPIGGTIRGGSFFSTSGGMMRSAARGSTNIPSPPMIGFRCVRY